MPVSHDWVKLTTEGCGRCTFPAPLIFSSKFFAVIFPFSPFKGINFAPPVKNSGAPHSSVFMWEISWQYIFPKTGLKVDSAKEFEATPDVVGKTSISFSKISENFFFKFID